MSSSQADEKGLSPELKAKWLTALRSDEFEQGEGELCAIDDDTGDLKYCCLGVLSLICGVKTDLMLCESSLDDVGLHDLLGPWSLPDDDAYSLNTENPETINTTQRKLAVMNDGGKSFAEIADWIEANL